MKESIFQGEVKSSICAIGGYCRKIPDHIAGGETQRFIPRKPADLFGNFKGMPFLIECKQVKEHNKGVFKLESFKRGEEEKLGISPMDSHQIVELVANRKSLGMSYIFVNNRLAHKKGVPNSRKNDLYIFDIQEIVDMMCQNVKEIHLDRWQSIGAQKGGYFDLLHFFNIEWGRWVRHIV